MRIQVVILLVGIVGCGLTRNQSQSSGSDQVAENASPRLVNASQDLVIRQIIADDPDIDSYSGRCVELGAGGFLNNVGESCRIVSQSYDSKTDVCTEKVQCVALPSRLEDEGDVPDGEMIP